MPSLASIRLVVLPNCVEPMESHSHCTSLSANNPIGNDPRHYRLQCPICGARFHDDGFLLECPHDHSATGLLTTKYRDRAFNPDSSHQGLFRYRHWLPAIRHSSPTGNVATYRSDTLNRAIGLPNLWIAFSGYFPERGATLETASFKELEAHAVLSRLPPSHRDTMVLASAGNTAAAFAWICSQNRVPCLIVVPERGLYRMEFFEPLDPCVKVVCLRGLANYNDAIALAKRVSQLDGFFPEGGVKNVGRRDGIGTILFNAVETLGQLPDYYFQAIGSGSGGIAICEAAKRLVADGRFGRTLPRLMLSQNLPFIPIYRAWSLQCRELGETNGEVGNRQMQEIVADVLSNQYPPYGIRGGVFDALSDSGGTMFAATNEEALRGVELFREMEGADIDPAAGIALATLIKAVSQQQLDREATILLHVTGGGRNRRQRDRRLFPVRTALELEKWELENEHALAKIIDLFH